MDGVPASRCSSGNPAHAPFFAPYGYLPKLTPGCEYGKIKYQRCDYHFTDSTYLDSNNGMFVSNDGILTLPIVAAHSTDVNKQIGKITAPVVAANYQQFEHTQTALIDAVKADLKI